MTDHATLAREMYTTIRGRLIYPSNAEDEKAAAIEILHDALTRAAEEAQLEVSAWRKHAHSMEGARDQALARLQAAQPVWRKDKPEVEGPWWYRENADDQEPCVVLVHKWLLEDPDDLLGDGEWAGPLPMPREA